MSEGRIPVSVLILTLDEEANLPSCMAALHWCDDIVVLDSFSSDRTCEIAAGLGARVHQREFDNFAAQRNHALDNIEFRHEWVLHIDADEVVTPELRDEIAEAVTRPGLGAFLVPSKLMFEDQWLRYSGMYPSYQVRLGKIGSLRFQQVGHGQRESLCEGELGTLAQPYLHYNFSKGMANWIEKHRRYAAEEARERLASADSVASLITQLFTAPDQTTKRRALKSLAARLPFKPALRFVYMYLLRLGMLDGRAGFMYCRMLARYESWITLQEHELRKARQIS